VTLTEGTPAEMIPTEVMPYKMTAAEMAPVRGYRAWPGGDEGAGCIDDDC
jgi:hypothetical protein